MKRLGIAAMVLLALALGFSIGWHKDAISAHLSRWHNDVTRSIPSPSPSPGALVLPESSEVTAVQTPDAWPSLVDQLRREGIELRDQGDTTTAIERFKEALDSEPNNAAVLEELAKTYDSILLHDSANEVWRKIQEMGPSAGTAYQLADRRLKLGAPTPAATAISAAPNSASPEVNSSAPETADDSAKYAVKPRENEMSEQPLPSPSTPTEVAPAIRASPAESISPAQTVVGQRSGRLIVLRAPNFGWNLALNVKIDGRTAANVVQGGRFDQVLPEGRHVLTVSAVPNYQPTSIVLNVQHGGTYVFTALRQIPDSVVLVPSALPPGQTHESE